MIYDSEFFISEAVGDKTLLEQQHGVDEDIDIIRTAAQNLSTVLKSTAECVCARCSGCSECWDENFYTTKEAFSEMGKAAKKAQSYLQ